MNILITNDDGITSDGIVRLASAAAGFGDVWIVAPSKECSGGSHSLTLRHSMQIHPHDFPAAGIRAFSCTGTPADCVRVAVCNIMPQAPDVVLAGVNYGYNMASDIQYSATLGAVFEAEFQGYAAIAFSEAACGCHEVADRYLKDILEELIHEPYIPGQVLNVNFPGCTLSECRGVLRNRKVSRLAYYRDHYNVLGSFSDGGMELMVEGVHEPARDEGTDYDAVLQNYVSVGRVRNIS